MITPPPSHRGRLTVSFHPLSPLPNLTRSPSSFLHLQVAMSGGGVPPMPVVAPAPLPVKAGPGSKFPLPMTNLQRRWVGGSVTHGASTYECDLSEPVVQSSCCCTVAPLSTQQAACRHSPNDKCSCPLMNHYLTCCEPSAILIPTPDEPPRLNTNQDSTLVLQVVIAVSSMSHRLFSQGQHKQQHVGRATHPHAVKPPPNSHAKRRILWRPPPPIPLPLRQQPTPPAHDQPQQQQQHPPPSHPNDTECSQQPHTHGSPPDGAVPDGQADTAAPSREGPAHPASPDRGGLERSAHGASTCAGQPSSWRGRVLDVRHPSQQAGRGRGRGCSAAAGAGTVRAAAAGVQRVPAEREH